MSLLYFFFPLLFITIFLLIPVITFIHEMGHAIPALIFTKENIEIYIGSYLDKKQTIKFNIGRTSFYIKYNHQIFKFTGACHLQKGIHSFYKRLIFILGGPCINLFTGFIAFYYSYNYSENGLIKLLCAIFILFSLFDFWINLLPKSFIDKDGVVHKSDGKRLQDIFNHSKIIKHADRGDVFLNNKDYQLALTEYEKCFKLGFDPHVISGVLSTIYIQLKKYNEVEQLVIPKIENNTAHINDFYFIAYVSIMKNDFEQAISFARKALEIDNNNKPTLNLLGYCLIEVGNLEDAEICLSKAIEDDGDEKSYALNNLGYLKIIKGDLEDGLLLIEESLQLNTTNGYAYRNRGIYHFKKEQFALTKLDFEKANEIEPDVLHLDEWMQQLQHKI